MVVLQLFATLALLVAGLLTVLLAGATQLFTARPPSGPDAMGLAGVFFGMALRSGLMLVAALVCVGLGKFDWVSGRPGVPLLAVIGSMIGLAVVMGMSWMQWAGPSKPWTVMAGNLGAVLLPLLIQVYLLLLVWAKSPGDWARHLALPLAGIGGIGLLIGAAMLVMWQVNSIKSERAAFEADVKWQEDNRRENREREERQAKELDGLPDDAPLKVFVTHLFIDKSEAHHARALERIGKLPNLTERIDALMSDADPLQREYCANYIRHAPGPDPAWGRIVKRAMGELAKDISAAPLLYDPPTQRTYRGMMMGMFLTARCFPGEDFSTEARAIREAVAGHADEINRQACVELADRFIAGQALEEE
ncbi:MAG: hypothetical protein IT436_11985 [Phycisphaerales bacterium]|nr:hypothetical protein [Phycisphaerales bacterium]